MATLNQIIVELDTFSATSVKKLVSNITANLRRDTPVDTGWARANWVPNIGTRNEGTTGSPQSVSNSAQNTGLLAVQATYKISDGKVFISNNVPYIRRLNNGHSQQAPTMFIEASVARGVRQTNV